MMQLSRFETELLLAYVLKLSRASIRAHPNRVLTKEDQERFNSLVDRRIKGEPIPYIVGHKEFWSLSLEVSPDVLIPRPETEILVQAVLDKIPNEAGIRILDLGTGSGAIALALASARPEWQIVATDNSEKALSVAQQNAKRLSLHNVDLLLGDWFDALLSLDPSKRIFNAVVSNPPYIAASDPHLNQNDLRFEPKNALVSGIDGLKDLKHIIETAPPYIMSKGWLFLEHGYNQGLKVLCLLRDNGFVDTQDLKDFADVNRVAMGQIL